VAAAALLLHAAGRRLAVIAWALLAACFAIGQVGELLKLPDAVTGLSPYTHLPAMPVESFAATPTVWLTAIATALTVTAWWRYRERDIG
jgi:ABC-2 type transport system permease protein